MDTNVLYYGDNLEILRKYIPDSSIDLVYLDPPFNSKATYNVLYKEKTGEPSQAQITAFEDTWHWGLESEKALQEIFESPIAPSAVKDFMSVMPKFLGKKTDMAAYLAMMCVRLVELKRVLKETGSIYLHCDPTASHYLKIVMDAIFYPKNFRNEIIWRRTASHNQAKRYGPIHDVILYYSKADKYYYKVNYRPLLKGHVTEYFTKENEKGKYWTNALTGAGTRKGESGLPWKGYDPTKRNRHWAIPGSLCVELGIPNELSPQEKLNELYENGEIVLPPEGSRALPTYHQYLNGSRGIPFQDIWVYQPHTKNVLYQSEEAIDEDVKWLTRQGDTERLGYETQKPLGLLRRIIECSCPQDGVLLDPFCGCGTAVVEAERLNRKWIGIDITHLAISTMKWRLEKMFPNIQYIVVGEPKDLAGAKELASQNKYQFQWWAVALVGGQPYGDKKKGADTGIDGYLYFMDEKNKVKKGIIQVKSGEVGVRLIRDLVGVVKREKAEMGIFLCLEPITKPMQTEADSEGFYHSPLGKDYPKIQILTIEQLLAEGKKPDIPPWIAPVGTPPTAKKTEGKAIKML